MLVSLWLGLWLWQKNKIHAPSFTQLFPICQINIEPLDGGTIVPPTHRPIVPLSHCIILNNQIMYQSLRIKRGGYFLNKIRGIPVSVQEHKFCHVEDNHHNSPSCVQTNKRLLLQKKSHWLFNSFSLYLFIRILIQAAQHRFLKMFSLI